MFRVWNGGELKIVTEATSADEIACKTVDEESTEDMLARRRKNGQTTVPRKSVHYDNADLARLIATTINLRKSSAPAAEEKHKMSQAASEDGSAQASTWQRQNREKRRSISVGLLGSGLPVTFEEGAHFNSQSDTTNHDDDTMTAEEEEAARRLLNSQRGPAISRRSVQYDNPDLMRLTSSNTEMGIRRKHSTGARPGSFSDERRMSYRSALEKLMPSSMVNEHDQEECGEKQTRSPSEEKPSDTMCNGVQQEDAIYKMFRNANTGKVCMTKFVNTLTASGIRASDHRLRATMQHVKSFLSNARSEFDNANNLQLKEIDFKNAIRKDASFITRILRTDFVIPEWHEFCRYIFALYSACKRNSDGQVSNFIPQLGDYDPKLWGVSVCTVDGQRFSTGDVDIPFCLHACCRVLNYAIALNDHGTNKVHKYVGLEPSGRDSRELVLDENKKPHNSMINAGAIAVTALLKDKETHMANRFESIYEVYSKMAGKEHMGFSNTSYLSERQIAFRNYALGYFLRENKCLPHGEKLMDTLELLLQLYSVEVTCESLSVMAATLANGGVCPAAGESVISSDCIRDVLSVMSACGMNEYSGKFAFHIGLPARSSISGAIMLVIPNVMGVCVWSPPVDRHENSERGLQFCTELVKIFNFHNYDNLRFTQRKSDPRRMRIEIKAQQVVHTLFSAANGDITALKRFLLQGVDLAQADYDGRTPLHVAASEGHMHCVEFLLQRAGVPSQPTDRWGNTPEDDARAQCYYDIAEYLSQWDTEEMQQGGKRKLKRGSEPYGRGSFDASTMGDYAQTISDNESGEATSVVSS